MKKIIFGIIYCLICLAVITDNLHGHQFTPTYPKLSTSYVDGILKTDMVLFNARKDVSYYEVTVYDGKWNPVSFATVDKISHVPHNKKKVIEVFVRKADKNNIVYICTESRMKTGTMTATFISSRVCSKVKP